MIKKSICRILIIVSLVVTGCSSFIPDEESDKISKNYQAGEYILLQDVNRNNQVFPKDSVVKLLVFAGDDWIKVYAYNSSDDILTSNRFLILYLFEEDFPDGKFSQEFLNSELMKIVRQKTSAEKPQKVIKKKEKK